jgi:hypothetical protein
LTPEEGGRLAWLSLLPRVRVGLYEITDTQFRKGLVDANETIRASFAATGFHDFEAQEPEPDAKRVLPIWLLTSSGPKATKIALYRPQTRGGVFYRLWIYKFVGYLPNARAGDVMALVQDGTTCVAINLTLFELIEDRIQILSSLFWILGE